MFDIPPPQGGQLQVFLERGLLEGRIPANLAGRKSAGERHVMAEVTAQKGGLQVVGLYWGQGSADSESFLMIMMTSFCPPSELHTA